MLKYLRPYYVPVVAKNRDYLVGFFEMGKIVSNLMEIDYTLLDSTKYNDLLPNGKRRREMTLEELKGYLEELENNKTIHEDNPAKIREEEVSDPPFLEIDCVCGNSHRFDVAEQIPRTNLICEVCGKVLIDYTGYEDSDFVYDGDIDLAFVTIDEIDQDEEEE